VGHPVYILRQNSVIQWPVNKKYLVSENQLNRSDLRNVDEITTTKTNATKMGTANILCWKYKPFSMGNNITCTMNCNYRTAATLCTLGTLFQVYNCKHPANRLLLLLSSSSSSSSLLLLNLISGLLLWIALNTHTLCMHTKRVSLIDLPLSLPETCQQQFPWVNVCLLCFMSSPFRTKTS